MNRDVFTSHGFELSPEEFLQFERLLALFIEYNTHTNLSAIRDEEGIIEKHFIDSLYGAEIIHNYQKNTSRVLDIGSGGGFPGIPLKIVMPDISVTLLDSVGKKVKAMNHFASSLDLENITAIQERAEVLGKHPQHAGKYDFVVSRATAYITDILTWALPFLTGDGKILLYKMPSDEEKKDREKILKKLGLILEAELDYELAGKSRVIYIIGKKK